MSLGKNVRKLREARGWEQKDLALASGVSNGTISAIEVRDSRRSAVAPALARALGVTLEQLMSEDMDALVPAPIPEPSNVAPAPAMRASRKVAVVGEVKGGDHGYLEELQYPVGYGEGTVDFPTADPMAYALRVRGDSMHPRYRAGEFVVVEPSVEALPGDDVVVAMLDGRKLLKELGWWRDDEVQLLSINNHFGPMTLERQDIASIQLVAGRVRRGAINRPF